MARRPRGGLGAATRAPFGMVIVDDLEVASVLEEALLASVPAPAHVERGWAVIALDQPMAWDIGAFSPR